MEGVERDGGRRGEGERGREVVEGESHMDKHTGRQTDTVIDIKRKGTDTQTHSRGHRLTEKQQTDEDRKTDTQGDRKTDIQIKGSNRD